MYEKNSFFHNFIHGVGSIMNIYPSPKVRFPYYNSYNSLCADFESLKTDWESVGKDLSNTFEILKKDRELFEAMKNDWESVHKSFSDKAKVHDKPRR